MSKYTPVRIAVAPILAIAVSLWISGALHHYTHTRYHSSPPPGPGSHTPLDCSSPGEPARTFDDLLDAIEWVESKGDPWAVGDNGNAVGAYQIHKIYVDDVNRISGYREHGNRKIYPYAYTDRANPQKSREIVTVYLKHYGGTCEEMARTHNGGPRGPWKESTKAYWIKVKARMEGTK